MSIQQTGASMPGGGKRAQGVALPSAEVIAKRMEAEVDALVEARNPGLRKVLHTLWTLTGGAKVLTEATIPPDKIRHAAMRGQHLEHLATEVTIEVDSARAVAVLQQILTLGIDAYLAEEVSVCRHCDEPVQHRASGDGSDVVWFHRVSKKMLCADGVNVATKRNRPKRDTR